MDLYPFARLSRFGDCKHIKLHHEKSPSTLNKLGDARAFLYYPTPPESSKENKGIAGGQGDKTRFIRIKRA
jgi:hypothetical protein